MSSAVVLRRRAKSWIWPAAFLLVILIVAGAFLVRHPAKDGSIPAPPGSAFDPEDWPDWRGPGRLGQAGWLPARLPTAPKIVWRKQLHQSVLAGVAVAQGFVVTADRHLLEEKDIFRCLRAEDGEQVWALEYPAMAQLDYGLSPRATPVIRAGKVYLLGGCGDLHCVELSTGRVLWQRHLVRDFGARLTEWGYCSTPLLTDGKLIVNPGARDASVVALNPQSGSILWKSPGAPAAYASSIVGTFGGRRQVVGYDKVSLGGWDIGTGRRLWNIAPPNQGDFNVPTPVPVGGRLLVATENNGARLYEFGSRGEIVPRPVAENPDLSPDTSSPVVIGNRLFGCHQGLWCLDLDNGLKPIWRFEDEALNDHASLIFTENRLLVSTYHGELLLFDAASHQPSLISRLRVIEADSEIYSHPALAGHRLYLRAGSTIACLDLRPQN